MDDDEGDDASGSAFSDEEGSVREFLFDDEETRTLFTDYSMTSSVMRRNEQLTLLDDRFEKVRAPLCLSCRETRAPLRFCIFQDSRSGGGGLLHPPLHEKT